MEEKQLTQSQILAIGKIEYYISIFYDAPENFFEQIIKMADEQGIAEHKETMNYIYELFLVKGYREHAEEFAKRYHVQTEKT